MYCTLVDSLMGKLVSDLKTQAIKKKMASAPQYRSESESEEEIELEIDNSFFKQSFVPSVHQTLMSSLSISSLPLFNFVVSLRLA
jgi:hypothetical protein